MHRQNILVCGLITVWAVSIANEEICMSSSILTYDLLIHMQPKL